MNTTTEKPITQADTRIIVSSSVFKQAIARLLPFVKSQPILPILENALLNVENGLMTLVVSDLQQTMIARIPCELTQDISICFPIRKVARFLATIPEQPITLVIPPDESYKLTIIVDSPEGTYVFGGENPMDFPKVPEFTPYSSFSLPITQLRDLFRTVSSFMTTDDLRPAMTGLYWSADIHQPKGHELAATDGHRLIRLQPDIEKPEHTGPMAFFSAIIPRNLVNTLKTILPAKGDKVIIEVGELNAKFSWGWFTVIARLIDERFPDYNSAIPENNSIVVRLNKADFIASVRRAMVFANATTHQIKLTFDPNVSTIHAENLDYFDTSKERLPVIDMEGESIIIGANGKLLLEILSVIQTPTIELRLSAANRAFILHPYAEKQADESMTFLQMPVMLNTYA